MSFWQKNKSFGGPVSGESDDNSRDVMGHWSKNYKTANTHRATARALRFMTFFAAIQTLSLIALIFAFSDLLPLRRDVPYLMQVFDGGRVAVKVGPLLVNSDQRVVLAKTMVVEYVKIRHEVLPDASEMNRRWGSKCIRSALDISQRFDKLCSYVLKHSSPGVYRDFIEQNKTQVKKMIDTGIERRVKIIMEPFEKGPNIYEVRFLLKDFAPNDSDTPNMVRERSYVATLWIKFATVGDQPKQEIFLNPTRFKVVQYRLAQSERKKKDRQ